MGAVALIGLAVSAASAAYSGYAASQSANYQAAIAEHQAKVAEENALTARQTTERQQEQTGLQGRARSGAVRSALAAGNVTVDAGSAAGTEQSQESLNVNLAREVGITGQQVWKGFKDQGDTSRAQAKLDRMMANADITGGMLGGMSAFAKGLGNYNMNYGGY